MTPTSNISDTFGLTVSDDFYTIDTASGLIFKIRRQDHGSNYQSPGDISSMLYNGEEYQVGVRGSQINSGFDYLYTDSSNVDVQADKIDENVIQVTVTSDYLTHYYIAKKGEPHIYMATIFEKEPRQGYVRYILRIQRDKIPFGPPPSNLKGNTGIIEAKDIFGMPNGETRSKHYSNQRLCDWSFIGATAENVGIWVVRGNTEGMSGGPFYRSLLNQCGQDQEITYIINYGMAQTEHNRLNILNIYTLAFTDSSEPSTIDTSWLSGLKLKGWVGPDDRGTVTGFIQGGMAQSYDYRIGFSNDNAQYWADVLSGKKTFECESMLPGIYDVSIFKNEIVCGTGTVTVNAGKITQLNELIITNDPSSHPALWRIGDWSGSPEQFLNGDKVTTMHPSDVRMANWVTEKFIIGESKSEENFPAYVWKELNANIEISFRLSNEEIADYKLRIGITISYSGGRPNIVVNGKTYHSDPSAQPKTRSLTVGTYRGNNHMYTYNVSADNLLVGENLITIGVASGMPLPEQKWLHPGFAVDAIDFIKNS